MPPRPLSPHLSVYKFKYTLTTSILNRFTAVALSVALVLLSIWFVASLLSLGSFDHATVVAWMSGSWTALLLILFVLVAAWHSQLGVRVVVEDYVHGAAARTVTLVSVLFAHTLIAAAGVFAVLKVAFGAAP